MTAGERRQHKLSAVRHFDVSDVVSRSAGPSGFGPQAKTFAALQRHAGEAASLIVSVAGLSRVVAFEKLHHRAVRAGFATLPVTISIIKRAVASVVSLLRFSPFGPRETLSRP